MKSKLGVYLEEGIYILDSNNSSFNTLEWWKSYSLKYKSKMTNDILVIPVSTVVAKATFSVGGRVIDEYRSKLNEESIEALIYGGDWLRHKYNMKRKKKVLYFFISKLFILFITIEII